ncbi:MAG: capsule biosynthesis protein, partial [Prevotella sp.]|nr:capsule biosynthesis protein [Prevotella sp.]
MKKYIIMILMVLCSVGATAQSSMTDNQVLEFVMKEHQRGTSQAQIVTKLMQKGVNINQIRRVRAMAERMQGSSALGTVTEKTKTDDRTRRNNALENRSMTKEDIANQTRRIYADDEETASQFSNYRVRRYADDETNTYDEYDEDFLEMQDEM